MIEQKDCPFCLETWEIKGVPSNKGRVTFEMCSKCRKSKSLGGQIISELFILTKEKKMNFIYRIYMWFWRKWERLGDGKEWVRTDDRGSFK